MKPVVLLALLLGFQLVAACAESAEHKAPIEEMDRRHTVMIETMSGTGGK